MESDVFLTSAKGTVGVHLADHAMALLLGLIRGIATAVRNPSWDQRMPIRNATWELADRTMGIVGLAVFSINRRRKQIGTRRALGATRFSILRYFMTENLIISAAGVTLGAIMTVGFNMFLVQTFNMPRIDWFYAPIGMLALLLLGQLAVIGPARSAAAITPALATRSV